MHQDVSERHEYLGNAVTSIAHRRSEITNRSLGAAIMGIAAKLADKQASELLADPESPSEPYVVGSVAEDGVAVPAPGAKPARVEAS